MTNYRIMKSTKRFAKRVDSGATGCYSVEVEGREDLNRTFGRRADAEFYQLRMTQQGRKATVKS